MDNHVTQYTLHLGDCLEIMPTIPSGSVDLILCDLPYGTTACAWDVIIPFAPLWTQYKRVIKQNGAILLFGSQPFTTDLINSNRKWFRYEWVWHKNTPSNIANIHRMPLRYHENLCVFYKAQPTYNAIPRKRYSVASENVCKRPVNGGSSKSNHTRMNNIRTQYDPATKSPETVIHFPSVPNSSGKLHPTQKPVGLAKYMIRTYSNEGDTVLDNCMGSGTTGVAAVELGRYFIGIEKEPRYFEIAQRRLKEAAAQPDLFLAAI